MGKGDCGDRRLGVVEGAVCLPPLSFLRLIAAQDFARQTTLMLTVLIEDLARNHSSFDTLGLSHESLAPAGKIPYVLRIFRIHRVRVEQGQISHESRRNTTALGDAEKIRRHRGQPAHAFIRMMNAE